VHKKKKARMNKAQRTGSVLDRIGKAGEIIVLLK
jgi:hypothetical protein